MIALYIIFTVILLLALVMLLKLEFSLGYVDNPVLVLKVLFLRFTLVPVKSKKKSKKPSKKPKEKTSVEKKKKSKKPSAFKKMMDKKGLSGIVEMFCEFAKLATSTLKGIFENINITKFDVDITVASDNAADTALEYGKVCGVFYSAVSVVCSVTKCREYNLNLTPDFDDEAKGKISCDIKFYIRVFYVVKYALKALYKALVLRYKK